MLFGKYCRSSPQCSRCCRVARAPGLTIEPEPQGPALYPFIYTNGRRAALDPIRPGSFLEPGPLTGGQAYAGGMNGRRGDEVSMTLREREEQELVAAIEAARTPEERARLRRGRKAWEAAAAEYVAGAITATELAARAADGV